MRSPAESNHEALLWGTTTGGVSTTNVSSAISTMAERYPGEHMVLHSDGCRVLLDGCTCHPVIVMPSSRVA